MKTRRANRNGGFTMAETVIAAGVLGILVASLISAYFFGFGLIRYSQEAIRADQIMLQKLELLRVYGWSQTCSNGYFPTTFTGYYWPATASGTVYSGTISITNSPLTQSYTNQIRQVTVTLNWTSGTRPCNSSMTTLVAQNGIQTYKN